MSDAASNLIGYRISSTNPETSFATRLGDGIRQAVFSTQDEHPFVLNQVFEHGGVKSVVPIRSDRNAATEDHYPTHVTSF